MSNTLSFHAAAQLSHWYDRSEVCHAIMSCALIKTLLETCLNVHTAEKLGLASVKLLSPNPSLLTWHLGYCRNPTVTRWLMYSFIFQVNFKKRLAAGTVAFSLPLSQKIHCPPVSRKKICLQNAEWHQVTDIQHRQMEMSWEIIIH